MKITFEGNKKVKVRVKDFDIWTDQPKEQGGDSSAPTPIDLFLASLGSCSGVFVLNFLKQHALPENAILLTIRRGDDDIRELTLEGGDRF